MNGFEEWVCVLVCVVVVFALAALFDRSGIKKYTLKESLLFLCAVTICSLVGTYLVCSILAATMPFVVPTLTFCMMYVVGILMIIGFRVLYQGTLHSIILTWGLDEAYRTVAGKDLDSDAYKRALKILGGGAALVAIYWSRLPGIDALITRMAAGMNSGCIAFTARMIVSQVGDPDKYQQTLNLPETLFCAGLIQYGIGLLMLWGLWSFYSGSLHSILLTWFLHETYSKVTSEGSVSSMYKNAMLVLEILTILVTIYWSRLPGIDSAVGGVMSAYGNMFTSLFGG